MSLWLGALASVPVALTSVAQAQEAPSSPAAPPPAARSTDGLLVDGGLMVAKPAALPTGLSTGVDAGVTRGGVLAWGARAAWSSATEHSTTHTVRHSDLRLHAVGALQHAVGRRGIVSLRLGAGGTLVHETRRRDQGERAGLTGDALETSAWRMLPSVDLEVAVSLALVDSWGLVMSGGPSVHLRDGRVHAGWIGTLGVAWQP